MLQDSFLDHMSMVEWLLTWELEISKVSFVKSIFNHVFVKVAITNLGLMVS